MHPVVLALLILIFIVIVQSLELARPVKITIQLVVLAIGLFYFFGVPR